MGTDELFSRTDFTGAYNPITDALGSVMADKFLEEHRNSIRYDPHYSIRLRKSAV